ncbi:MAG: hypothetical protein JSU91_01855 [Thermoplasmatales archaeon]|nr:MAG: hypothetical protein JSU91_01855 [Thermoplasmatales archaeon]
MDLEINGQKYTGFLTAKVTHSIDEICHSLQFTATSDSIKNYPIKNNAECSVFIGAREIFNGYIDIIEPIYSADSHTINIQGRSKASVLVDSSVWDSKTFKGPSSFLTIAQRVLADIESDIIIIDQTGAINTYKKDISAEPGESVFSFLERLAQKSQFMLVSDGSGNLNMIRTGLIRNTTLLLNQKNGDNNNILTGSASYDYSRRYSEYRVVGQASSTSNISNEGQTKIIGTATDRDMNITKKLEIVVDQDLTIDQAKKLAQWECNIRRARSQKFNCTVYGHEKLIGLWDINQITRVVDDYANIDSDMLIKSVEYTESNDGTFTNIELVPPDAYSLEENRPIFSKQIDEIGNDLDW